MILQDNRFETEIYSLQDPDETWNLQDWDLHKWVSRLLGVEASKFLEVGSIFPEFTQTYPKNLTLKTG